MIEINLLPELYRKTEQKAAEKFPLNLILLAANGILFVVLLLVGAINLSQAINLRALNNRLGVLAPEQRKISAVRQKTENLKRDNALFSGLFVRNFLWSKKLNQISDLLIPGIWLQGMSLQKEIISVVPNAKNPSNVSRYSQLLMINGTAVSLEHNEMALINELIRNLKSDADFFSNFRSIELESVLRRNIVAVEAMDFTLRCCFKEGN